MDNCEWLMAKSSTSAIPFFSQLKILNFQDTFSLESAKLMYDINNNGQAFFPQFFEKTNFQHDHKTCKATNKKFAIQKVRTNYKKRFLTYNEIKIWNDIPLHIREKSNKTLFFKYFPNHLLNNSTKL